MSLSAREAAKLFNSNRLSALADGDLSFVERVGADFLEDDVSQMDVLSIYENVYCRLSKEYRSEYYFKNIIAKRRLLGKHSLNTATMLSEFRVGKSKADCVIVNGKTTCYEIKTEYDNLSRLDEQLNDYLKLFDEVFVVCSGKNLSNVLANTDERVGVLELTQKSFLSEKRPATPREKPIDVDVLIKSLRKEEYIELVRKTVGETPNVPNSRLMSTCTSLLKTIDSSNIATCFIEVLKEKRLNDANLINALPDYLINAAISYQFSSVQAEALKQIFGANKELICTYPTSEENNLN